MTAAIPITVPVPVKNLENTKSCLSSIKKERDDESKAIRIAGIVFLVLALILFITICICTAGIGLFAAGALIVSFAVLVIVGIGMVSGSVLRDNTRIWNYDCDDNINQLKMLGPLKSEVHEK